MSALPFSSLDVVDNNNNTAGMSVIRKEFLLERGFNFKYFTSLYQTKDGNEYWFCYDIGYLSLEENKVRIIEHQNYMKP